MLKEWQHQTAHGNFTRIRWTPEGLEIDSGQGFRAETDELVKSIEYCHPDGCRCPQAFLIKKIPDWWRF
jgi:hypothetical protein